MIDRMDRVAEAIKREVAVILQEEVNDPKIRHVTVTRVEVTRDLRLARVFYIVSAEEKNREAVAEAMKHAGSFVRGELGKRLPMKFTPKVSFREDRDYQRKEAMDNVFRKIETEFDQTQDDDEV